eukprot:TRINITY_DN15528_c0_g1_i2.p1 TRINITY_DN15528_c0_g1~~TRINITY_DN15528_c0_g1_i2.p1  ORF type:complete len:584 (+),score=74.61 TRINITY_DN15528_c0_g1_i2:99-1850(+)
MTLEPPPCKGPPSGERSCFCSGLEPGAGEGWRVPLTAEDEAMKQTTACAEAPASRQASRASWGAQALTACLPPCHEQPKDSVERHVLRRVQALIKESQSKLLSDVSELVEQYSTVSFCVEVANPLWVEPTKSRASEAVQRSSTVTRSSTRRSATLQESRFRDMLGGKLSFAKEADIDEERELVDCPPQPVVTSDGPASPTSTKKKNLRTSDKHKETGLAGIVNGSTFELVFAFLIALNALAMCLEAQYEGFQTAHLLDYGEQPRPAKLVWPYAATMFHFLEFAFGVIFTLEVAVKIFALRQRFIYSAWNWFDSCVIFLWLVNTLSVFSVGLNPTFLRVARLGRLMRLLRFVKSFQVFDVLWLLIESVNACASVLLWSLVLLFLCMMVCTLFLNFLLAPVILDPGYTTEQAFELYQYFGTFSRGLLSMYEVTMGNYVPIARTLHELVSEWFLPCVLAYRCLVSFALMKVISGIFLHETFKTAASNDEIMIMQRDRASRRHVLKMTQLFKEADESGDGELTLEEFREVMADPRVKSWLAAQELEVRDVELVFELVDNGSGAITAEDLVVGFAQLKGPARSNVFYL